MSFLSKNRIVMEILNGKEEERHVVFDQILKRKKRIPFSKVNKEVAKKNEKKIGKNVREVNGIC